MATNITNFNQQAMDQQMLINQMRRAQFAQGGCQGPGFFPPQQPPYWQQGHGNLPYAQVQNGGFLGLQNQGGYATDLNNNGRYDAGQDAVLAMDLNRDGRVDRNEIEGSRRRLMSMGGNFDFNGDGKVGLFERMQGGTMSREMRSRDQDGDGRLSQWEFAQAGGRVMTDQNRDGNFQPWEQHSPFNFPTPGFGRGSVGTIDPFQNFTGVNHRGNVWGGGFPGGGFPGGGGYGGYR